MAKHQKTIQEEAEELDYGNDTMFGGAPDTGIVFENDAAGIDELRDDVDRLTNLVNSEMGDLMYEMRDYVEKDDFDAGRRVQVVLTRLKMDISKVLKSLEKSVIEKRKAKKKARK